MLRISCPKCGKGEKAELIEVQADRRYTFKCHHCNILFQLAAQEGDKGKIMQVSPKGQKEYDQKRDRRKNIRFLVRDDVIASLHNGTITNRNVKDMSMGGLAFEHMESTSGEISKEEYLDRNISLSVNEFSLSKVSCKIVYDIAINGYPGLSAKMLSMRYGVQFTRLEEDQTKQLDLFLKAYTKGVAPSWCKTAKERPEDPI